MVTDCAGAFDIIISIIIIADFCLHFVLFFCLVVFHPWVLLDCWELDCLSKCMSLFICLFCLFVRWLFGSSQACRCMCTSVTFSKFEFYTTCQTVCLTPTVWIFIWIMSIAKSMLFSFLLWFILLCVAVSACCSCIACCLQAFCCDSYCFVLLFLLFVAALLIACKLSCSTFNYALKLKHVDT